MANYPTNGSKLDSAQGKDTSTAVPRYANLDEFKSEFGSYRVNKKTDNLSCGKSVKDGIVHNDPYTNQAEGK